MSRVKIPHGAPKEGEIIEVVGGPADGRRVGFTGINLHFADLKVPAYVGDPNQPPDPSQIRLTHVYQLWRREHEVLGVVEWVYRYEGTESP